MYCGNSRETSPCWHAVRRPAGEALLPSTPCKFQNSTRRGECHPVLVTLLPSRKKKPSTFSLPTIAQPMRDCHNLVNEKPQYRGLPVSSNRHRAKNNPPTWAPSSIKQPFLSFVLQAYGFAVACSHGLQFSAIPQINPYLLVKQLTSIFLRLIVP